MVVAIGAVGGGSVSSEVQEVGRVRAAAFGDPRRGCDVYRARLARRMGVGATRRSEPSDDHVTILPYTQYGHTAPLFVQFGDVAESPSRM